MCLNDPETMTSTQVHGKNIFHATDPWCQKGWGPLLYVCVSVFQNLFICVVF